MPVTPTAGTEPAAPYSARVADATHLLPGALPPLPPVSAPLIHDIANSFSEAMLEELDLKNEREVDERSERQLLYRLLTDHDDQLYLGSDLVADDIFTQPLRVAILALLKELYGRHDSISAESVWNVLAAQRLEAENNPRQAILLEAQQRELLLVFQAHNGRQFEELLDKLKRTYRARAVSRLIFQRAFESYSAGEDVDKIIAGIEMVVLELGTKFGRRRRSWTEEVQAVYQQIINPDKTREGLSLGLKDFDRQFGGIKRDRVITIGGYTGSGKTAMLIDFIYRLLFYHKDKLAIKFFSFEMSVARIIQRLFSRIAGVSVKKQDDWWVKVRYRRDEDGKEIEEQLMEPLTDDEIKRINAALPFLTMMEGVIDVEYGSYTIEGAEQECRRHALKNKHKHKIYLFDHLDLFDGDGGDNRLEFNKRMKGCKNIARSLDSTVIPLVQLGKSVESRFNRAEYFRPTSADIMESVGVEAASDIVMLLWRPSKFFTEIPYQNPDLGIFTSTEDPKEQWWDCRHRMIGVIVKNRDGASFNDVVFDADMEHSHLYNYQRLRFERPDLFADQGPLYGSKSYLSGETGGSQPTPEELPF